MKKFDYYPFGMMMPGRKYSAEGGYRYGFNGKENDNEVKGDGNQQDYGMRIYDVRLGKFLSVDPLTKKFPFYSPYHYAGNSPIKNIDLDGAEPAGNRWDWEILQSGKTYIAEHKLNDGTTVFARAEQQYVQDKTGWKGWITHMTWYESSHGLTEKANYFSWFNPDPNVGLHPESEKRWESFETSVMTRQRHVRENAKNLQIGVFGGAAAGAALPLVANLTPLAIRGLANEASLLKYIPKSYGAYAKVFGANLGLQYAFNGKDADVYDAAVGTWNPYIALFTNPIVNYKPLAGDVMPTMGADAPEVMAKKFVISAPFTLLGLTIHTVQPNFTADYLVNAAEEAADASVPDRKPSEPAPKPKK